MAAPILLRFGDLEVILCSKAAFRISLVMKARGSRRVEGGERSRQTRLSLEVGASPHELIIFFRGFIS